MTHIKRGDVVWVIAGKDKGKSGKVIRLFAETNRALVQGVNFVTKHTRKSQKDPQGGIIHKESSIHVSNVGFLCKSCQKPSRIGIKNLSDGSKARVCRRCKEVLS